MRVAPLLGFVVVLVLAVSASGCGGSSRLSKESYQRKLLAIGSRDAKGRGSVGVVTTSRGSGARRLVSLLNAEADELASLKPPAEAAADKAKLVAGLRAFARISVAALNANATGRAAQAAVVRAIQRSPELVAFSAALDDLRRKGYKLGAFASSGGASTRTYLKTVRIVPKR